jgi:hypothetical protein
MGTPPLGESDWVLGAPLEQIPVFHLRAEAFPAPFDNQALRNFGKLGVSTVNESMWRLLWTIYMKHVGLIMEYIRYCLRIDGIRSNTVISFVANSSKVLRFHPKPLIACSDAGVD